MQLLKQVIKTTLPSMTLLEKGKCNGCENDIEIYESEIYGGARKGEKTIIKRFCRCEDIKLAEQTIKAHERMLRRKVIDTFTKFSLINKELQKATYYNYKPKNESQHKAKESIKDFVAGFSRDKSQNLVLAGGFGVGKSHLAKVATDGVMKKGAKEEEGYTAIFITVTDSLSKIRGSYNGEPEVTESEILNALKTVDLLVLDDIGAEKQTEWVLEKILEVVNNRQGMSTIYTTNYDPERLYNLLGERNFSRVVNQDTEIVEVEGDNDRLKNFMKKT